MTSTTQRQRTMKAVAATAFAAALLVGGASAQAITGLTGSDARDDLIGTPGADRIAGKGGNDDIYGLGGPDTLRGGRGADDIEAGPGNDRLIPGAGQDDAYGGPGDDRIEAVDRHRDDISCGPGLDQVIANPGDEVARDCERVTRSGTDVSSGSAVGAGGNVITRAQAGQIAARHVGGVVDHIERDDDFGAAWEVDVTTPRGEYEVYVSATGRVVRVLGPFRD